jgi:hypothetical protein
MTDEVMQLASLPEVFLELLQAGPCVSIMELELRRVPLVRVGRSPPRFDGVQGQSLLDLLQLLNLIPG